MIECKICGQNFSRKDALTRHMKRQNPCVGSKLKQKSRDSSTANTFAGAESPKKKNGKDCSRMVVQDEITDAGNNETDDDEDDDEDDDNDDESYNISESDESESCSTSNGSDNDESCCTSDGNDDESCSDEDENDEESYSTSNGSDNDESCCSSDVSDDQSCTDEDENDEPCNKSNYAENDVCDRYEDENGEEFDCSSDNENNEDDRKSTVSGINKYIPYHPAMRYHVGFQSMWDRRRLLKEMLALQRKERAARERKRQLESTQQSHYTKIFEPITDSLKQLKPFQVAKVDASTNTTRI